MREMVVFVGPTLATREVAAELEATVRPPVSKGDVYSAARRRPLAIGIVDGYFDRVPSVWHKEILWAMSQGVHVFGSASMGALRAAELDRFGMVGVGAVFQAFLDGTLTDDDEVAVAHLPEALGYRPRSVAMVDIRATLAAAAEAGVVSVAQRDALVARAKAMHYAERSYEALLRPAEAGPGPEAEGAILEGEIARRLTSWIGANGVDRKKEDALAMLRRMRRLRQEEGGPLQVHYTFSHTLMWDGLKREVDSAGRAPAGAAAEGPSEPADATGLSHPVIPPSDVVEELRLDAVAHGEAMEGTWRRLLALELARARGERLDAAERARAEARWRRLRGLEDDEALEDWRAREGVDASLLRRLVEDEALLRRVEHDYAPNAEMYLRDHLRAAGRYGDLRERARRKRVFLEARGLENPGVADAGCSEAELWRWYFQDRLGLAEALDPEDQAARLGFSSVVMFTRAVVRERLFMSGDEVGRTRPHT